MSKINIFIPVYNGEKYLPKTIQNIRESSYKDFEVLFVDDGSTDSSISIIKAAASSDSRFKLFTKRNEGSVPYSWNFVFQYITAPWTLYMSQDDLIHHDLLNSLIKTQKTSDADCIIPSCCFFSEDMIIDFDELNRLNDMTMRANSDPISGREAFELMFDYEIPGFALWRTEIIRKLGMPTEAFNSDEGMQRIWALNCRKVAFVSEPFYYRQRKDSIGSTFKTYQFYSVRTEKKLLQVAKQLHIAENKIYKAQYKSLFWTLWLYSYLRNHRHKLKDQYVEIKNTLDDSFSYFSKNLALPVSKKDYIIYCATRWSITTNIYIYIYIFVILKI